MRAPEGMPARDRRVPGAAARGGGGRGGRRTSRQGAAGAVGPMGNEVYRSDDGGRTWRKMHGHDIDVAGSKAPYSFNQIRTNRQSGSRSS